MAGGTAPDPREVAELFEAALEMPKAERSGFLDRACAGRPALRAEIDALLRANDSAAGEWTKESFGRKVKNLVARAGGATVIRA